MLISRAQLLLQLNDVALETTNDCCTRTLSSQLHASLTALRSCASLVSIFRRCHAVYIASVAACSSASVRASPLQPRLSLLRSCSGITESALCMVAAANAASTSSTLLSPGGMSASTIGGGGGTTIPSLGMAPKQPLPGIALHNPLHGWQACPKFNSFHQGVGQISPPEGLFSCRPLPKRGQICYIPTPSNC